MLPNPLVLKGQQSVFTAKELMLLNELECLYVVDDEKRPIGVVTAHTATVETARRRVDKVMEPVLHTLTPGEDVREAAKIFSRSDVARSHLPVVDDEGAMVGLISMKSLIGVSTTAAWPQGYVSPEVSGIRLALTRGDDEEKMMIEELRNQRYLTAVTQVGASAEKLFVKLREAAIVAAIARGVIQEDTREKVAVSNAIRDVILQMDVVSAGLGGGYKVAVVRGEGRVAVAAFGRCGHALANTPEQLFVGSSVI